MITTESIPARQVVALFNSSDDTVDMVQRMLSASDFECLVGCRFADLKKGLVDFSEYVAKTNPEVVIFDITPPYVENWAFYNTLCRSQAMAGRGLVLTTTNKDRLDEAVGGNSQAFEVVGKPYDLTAIKGAIHAALRRVRAVQPPPAGG